MRLQPSVKLLAKFMLGKGLWEAKVQHREKRFNNTVDLNMLNMKA